MRIIDNYESIEKAAEEYRKTFSGKVLTEMKEKQMADTDFVMKTAKVCNLETFEQFYARYLISSGRMN